MKHGFYIAILLFAMFGMVSMVRFLLFQRKLMRYLLEKHTEKWEELTTVIGFGPGLANSSRGMKFLFSKDYFGDPDVLRLKVIVRNAFIYTFMGMTGAGLAFCVMVAFCP